jgi:D-3-phosphoglycerate dehydrogenase / 2-oxoglutarate reductase
MDAPSPRLLVSLRPREHLTQAISQAVPVPWTYAEGSSTDAWSTVEAMLVGSLDRELPSFDAATTPHLAFVQRIYTGVDGFPFDRLPPSVKVAGNVGAYAPFVAEHAVALALAAARLLVESHERVRRGQLRPPPEHRLLFRRGAVILGYGEIGRAIAERLAGFDMRIVGVNRTGRMAPGCVAMYPEGALATAVAEGDFVFDARPLTRSTRASVDATLLGAMRPEAVYVNVGRAGTVDEAALYQHLTARPTFRAALDVWWGEDFAHGRLEHRFPLADLPNFVGTPHVAGFGPGVESYVVAKALDNMARFFRGETPRHLVDRTEYAR